MSNRKSFFPSWNRTIAYGPVAVFHAGSLYSMFQALKYCSFRTVGVGRFIAPILTSLYEVFVLQSVRWSKIQFLYLVGTFMGAVLSFRDVEFYGNILSIPWITTSVVCTAGGTIYAKHLLQYKICPTQASYLENLYCSVFFLLQSFWSVPYGWKQQSWKDSVSLPWITKATFFVSVFTGYLITLSRQHLRKALGPTKFLVFVGLIRINSLFLVSKLLLKSLSWSGLTGVGLIEILKMLPFRHHSGSLKLAGRSLPVSQGTAIRSEFHSDIIYF
ncbi:hypothetical protein Gasu2_58450 [Galdieria sulphuraria]|nr:hypothetical protein Gasu2_58450 [Galdieria sulphuraria]